jgi:hypothetical protein
MREQVSAVDPVGRAALNLTTPLIICKSNQPMERAKNGARYFRNPPQPHMCIQDFIQVKMLLQMSHYSVVIA